MSCNRHLSKLEAITSPPLPSVYQLLLKLKIRLMADLAGQGPQESPAEAVARLLGYSPSRQMTDAGSVPSRGVIRARRLGCGDGFSCPRRAD
jgi:hypothetical protein